jgi:hypothetical protein
LLEALRRFLEKLAKANEKAYHGQNPDCCSINRPQQQVENRDRHR